MRTLIVFITALLFSATAYAAGLTIDKSATNTDLSAVTGSITIDGSAIGGGGSPTQEFWVPMNVSISGATFIVANFYPICRENGSGQVCATSFFMPADYSSLTSAVIVIIPDGSGSSENIDIGVSYGATGQNRLTHSGSDIASTYNITQNVFFEIDISGILASLSAGDHVGVIISHNGGVGIYVLGVRIKY